MHNPNQILRTKFHRPPISDDLVVRKLLIENLEKNRTKPFTLVSAPAGYGKSVTISQWIEFRHIKHVWISLDNEHNNFQVFLEYLLYAIRGVFPNSLSGFSAMIEAAEMPPFKVIANTFINEIDEIQEEFTLVLDDYHKIKLAEIHEFFNLYLQFPPQNSHLVLITRRDPPLKLNHLKIYNRSNEIRISHLNFSIAESGLLFKKQIGLEPDKNTLDKLLKITEGWIVGLRLSVLSVNKLDDLEYIIESSEQSNILISDFLFHEVLYKQTEELQQLLLYSSLLDRFCEDLINLISFNFEAGQETCSNQLEYFQLLTTSNLFLIPLDGQKQWFRYHHLFQQLLQKKLKETYSAEDIATYHTKFSTWFLSNSYYEEAVKHVLLAENNQLAVQIVIDLRYELMNQEKWNRLINLLNLLPDELIYNSPQLLVAKGFYYDYRGRVSEFFNIVGQIEEKYKQLPTNIQDYDCIKGEFYTLKAETYIISSDPENAKLFSKQALDLLPTGAQYIKTFAMYWYAFSNQMLGNVNEAIETITDALKNLSDFEPNTHTRLYLTLCGIYLMEGKLDALKETAEMSLELGEKYNFQETINISYYYLVCVHYLQNNFEEAKKYFDIIYKNRYTSRIFYTTLSSLSKSLIETFEGQHDQAWDTLNTISNFINEIGDSLCKETIAIFRTELFMYQNNFSLKEDFNRNIDYNFPPLWLNYHRQLSEVKFLYSIGNIEALNKALIKVNKHIEYGYAINNINFLIHALALKSFVLWKLDERGLAFRALKESLSMASKGFYIRTFVDLGDEMERMLKSYVEQNGENSFVNEILRVFKNDSKIVKKSKNISKKSNGIDFQNTLTKRELEILTPVAHGLRNKEIADKLYVSEDTIKKHLYNTFQKLDVSNRIELIDKAKELNILE